VREGVEIIGDEKVVVEGDIDRISYAGGEGMAGGVDGRLDAGGIVITIADIDDEEAKVDAEGETDEFDPDGTTCVETQYIANSPRAVMQAPQPNLESFATSGTPIVIDSGALISTLVATASGTSKKGSITPARESMERDLKRTSTIANAEEKAASTLVRTCICDVLGEDDPWLLFGEEGEPKERKSVLHEVIQFAP